MPKAKKTDSKGASGPRRQARRRRTQVRTDELFIEDGGQLRMVDKSAEQVAIESGRVECLGLTFDSEDARRQHFLALLREKLKDPGFRKIPGFPAATDEDILRLSDPPYFTACPNPFLEDFVRHHGRPYDPAEVYRREPFAVDVTEGKTGAIYTAHGYHTKVPPDAIVHFIEHYTVPGALVLDCFAGSGMTAVAAHSCRKNATSRPGSGPRIPIAVELSPAATFIAATYLWPCAPHIFAAAARSLLETISIGTGPRYSLSLPLRSGDSVDYIVWAETFFCPECQQSVVSDRMAQATDNIGTSTTFPCPHCSALVSKAPSPKSNASRLQRRLQTSFDPTLGATRREVARIVIAAAVRNPKTGRRLLTIEPGIGQTIATQSIWPDEWFPTDALIRGERFLIKDSCESFGITNIHHFYLGRQLAVYASLWSAAAKHPDYRVRRSLQFFVQSNALGFTVLNRYSPNHFSQVSRHFVGTLYVPSMISEVTPRYAYAHKLGRLLNAFSVLHTLSVAQASVSTQSATDLRHIPDSSIDYVFTDPPFGRNLQYSELNQIWEAWLRAKTNRDPEAVLDASRRREVWEYAVLMRNAFGEVCRVLKPGRWMTVVFHNSSNQVWAAIQEAIAAAGFVIADVRTLSKIQETYKQSRQNLVKQDLVISAYKPNGGLEKRFVLTAGTEDGVWDFVRAHLPQLPLFVATPAGQAEVIAERQAQCLYDRMVAFHVLRGVTVPLSKAGFTAGLVQRFPERDGMHFLPDQASEYDRRRMTVSGVRQLELFVSDESSAIQWVRQELANKPYTLQELTPKFMQEAQRAWDKHEQPLELRTLLEQNFLAYPGTGRIPEPIWTWMQKSSSLRPIMKDQTPEDANTPLRTEVKDRWYVPDPNRATDLERIRERALLKDFDTYRQASQRKLRSFRLEAVRAGFRTAWATRDYATILTVAGRLPEEVLQEDPQLLMWYDQALARSGADGGTV